MKVVPAFGGSGRQRAGYAPPETYQGKLCVFSKGHVRCFQTPSLAKKFAKNLGAELKRSK